MAAIKKNGYDVIITARW